MMSVNSMMKLFHERKCVFFHSVFLPAGAIPKAWFLFSAEICRCPLLKLSFSVVKICYDWTMKLQNDVISEQEIKKSRFITYLHSCDTEEEARSFFKAIRKQHPDASHHCTAIKIGSLMRSSDDGEPSGTAGRPMLDVLSGSEADHLCAVVVRYFGGTLLGKGGLVRAYAGGVREALNQAELIEPVEEGLWQVQIPYDLCGKLENLLRQKQAEIVSRDYLDQAVYCFFCKENLQPQLDSLFSGSVALTLLDTVVRNP